MHAIALRHAALALLLALATPAMADPTLRIHWDACDSATPTKSYAGPGAYTQVVTLAGFSEPVKGVDVWIQLLFRDAAGCPVAVPDAWRFDVGACQAGRVTASFAPPAGGCPVLGAAHRQSSVVCVGDAAQILHIATTFDAVTPSPDSTYALATITYDQSQSIAGPSHDGLCGGIDLAGCAQLIDLSFVRPDNSVGVVGAGWAVTWQSADGCQFCDPARPATWGRVKAAYR